MKLRIKKTGEVVEGHVTVAIKSETDPSIMMRDNTVGSVAELNEKYEDYEPVEPLIKDEKSRKAFREWADLFDAKSFRVNHVCDSCRKTTLITSTDITTEPSIELPGHIGEEAEIYAITELCGKEEE